MAHHLREPEVIIVICNYVDTNPQGNIFLDYIKKCLLLLIFPYFITKSEFFLDSFRISANILELKRQHFLLQAIIEIHGYKVPEYVVIVHG